MPLIKLEKNPLSIRPRRMKRYRRIALLEEEQTGQAVS
jgi:hypothetical protein